MSLPTAALPTAALPMPIRPTSTPAQPWLALTATTLLTALLLCAAPASAQSPASAQPPANARSPDGSGYAGPSSLPLMTVKSLLDTGRDDQKARLRGRILSHEGDDDYTFADDTGRIRVEIDRELFRGLPAIDANRVVELTGEFERDDGRVEFDVDRIRIP